MGTVGLSSRLTERLMRITTMGMSEQMMAAMPLGMCISDQATKPLPSEIRKKPAMACLNDMFPGGPRSFGDGNQQEADQ
jgi:hypothetical protein